MSTMEVIKRVVLWGGGILVFTLLAWGIKSYFATPPSGPTGSRVIASVPNLPVCPDCAAEKPCDPKLQADGSTEPVSFKGALVCFEPSFWDNLDNLHMKVTYHQGPEQGLPCTAEDHAKGIACRAEYTRFRFTPESGTPLPHYWFVPVGSTVC